MISAVSASFVLSAARVGVAQKQARGQVTTTIERSVDLPLEVQQDPVFLFKPETFKPYVGGIFTAPNALGQKIELELMNVKVFKPVNAVRYTRKYANTESFSLTFKAAAELPPFTSIHKINHPALGQFQLFLTKRVSDSGDLLYDAVINHIQ
jgi:hypothetical protein